MIVVFNQLVMATGNVAATFSPFVQKASTSATEVTNEIYWRTVNG